MCGSEQEGFCAGIDREGVAVGVEEATPERRRSILERNAEVRAAVAPEQVVREFDILQTRVRRRRLGWAKGLGHLGRFVVSAVLEVAAGEDDNSTVRATIGSAGTGGARRRLRRTKVHSSGPVGARGAFVAEVFAGAFVASCSDDASKRLRRVRSRKGLMVLFRSEHRSNAQL
jgi:hypothetical protein